MAKNIHRNLAVGQTVQIHPEVLPTLAGAFGEVTEVMPRGEAKVVIKDPRFTGTHMSVLRLDHADFILTDRTYLPKRRVEAFVVGFDGPDGFRDALKNGTLHLSRRDATFTRQDMQEEVGGDRAVVIHGFDMFIDLNDEDLDHWLA